MYKYEDLPIGQGNTNSCHCGVSITMGKDETAEMHSEWCPKSPNYYEWYDKERKKNEAEKKN